jgi:regulator-associated protein of mTOR
LRRVLSDGVDDAGGSLEQRATLGTASSHHVKSDRELLTYTIPESEIYAWKKDIFDTNFDFLADDNEVNLDPLSPLGAARAHHETKIAATRERADEIANHFASLAPKPLKPPRQSIEMLLEQEEEALAAAEEEAAAKRKKLELTESKIFRNEGVAMTTMLRFHPFDDLLVSCGGTGSVVVWDVENGSRLTSLENGNHEGSRMTTCGWINEESSNLFFVGCDDGTVRIWSDLQAVDRSSPAIPSSMSAFNALPMKAGQRGSGLVCEWQQWNGCLLAGGNSAKINCWDLHSETLVSKLETSSDANITTLTTAWDADQAGQFASPNGFGPDTLVGGFSDGTLRIFDLRTNRSVQELNSPTASAPNSRRRSTLFKEHKSWVVATCFTGYANRYELISGTVDGEIKA